MAERYWIETLGCPKNQVDTDKLVGVLGAEGLDPAESPAQADLVVVNTCAFIEGARQESIDTILELAAALPERLAPGRHRLPRGAVPRGARRGAPRGGPRGPLRRIPDRGGRRRR